MGLSGLVGAGAAEGLEDVLTRQLLAQQQAERERAQRAQEAAQQQRLAQEASQHSDRMGHQTRTQDFAEKSYDEETQQLAVNALKADRGKMDERLTRLSKEDDTESLLKEIAAMQGITPAQRTAAMAAARGGRDINAADMQTDTDRKRLRGEAVSDEIAVAEGRARANAKFRAPSGSGKEQTWVTRDGKVVPIAKGTAQPGDTPYDAVDARQKQPVNPREAQELTRTALGLIQRLKEHKGIGAATGAYEMRGFTQPAVDFDSVRSQVVAALSLPNLGAVRGPLSDKDILFVKQLSTRLANPRISEPETRQALAEAELFLNAKLEDGGPPAPTPAASHDVGGAVTHKFVNGKLVKVGG